MANNTIDFQGLTIRIENPRGTIRSGVNAEGEKWSRRMRADYGDVDGTTTSADGEALDVYVGRDRNAPTAWVVEQLKDDGEFDEYKVLIGFHDEEEALQTYEAHYPEGWYDSNVGEVWPISVERLKELVEDSAPAPKAKTAAFLREEYLRELGRKRLDSPEYKALLQRVAPGKGPYDKLTFEEHDALQLLEAEAVRERQRRKGRFASRLLQRQ